MLEDFLDLYFSYTPRSKSSQLILGNLRSHSSRPPSASALGHTL